LQFKSKRENMKKCFKSAVTICMALTTAVAITLPGYAQKQNKGTKSKEKPSDGIKLEYNFPVNKPLSYSSLSTVDQSMEVNGESMQVNVVIVVASTITSLGKENGNLKLDVRIDTLSQKVDSPQGSTGGPINEVAGKSFTMLLAPNGKEVDVTGAEKITYTEEGQETNVSQTFSDYFPDVPSKLIKPGDTWPTTDTIRSKATTMSMKQIVKADNKFEGIVNVDGIDCAKITAALSGTREQTGENMGMDIAVKGDFTGTSELYFALKEGYLIKSSSNTKMTGTIELSGAQNMSMPLTATMVSTKWLKK
jgi:hypothetical protein